MRYLLDTNVFISGARCFYPMNVFPGFWEWLAYEHKKGEFIIIDKVFHELQTGDELAIWTRNHITPISTNTPLITQEYCNVIQWTRDRVRGRRNERRYQPAAVNTFAMCADSYLIAYAKAKDCIVVTYEKEENKASEVKIPTICQDLHIACIKGFELFKTLNPVFTWEPADDETVDPSRIQFKDMTD